MCNLLDDRRRVRRLRRAPGQPRCHAFGGVAGAAREAAGVQAADEVEFPLGVLVRQRLQRRLQRLIHRGATARGGHRIQLPARAGVAVTQRRRDGEPHAGDACRRQRGHDRNRPGHVHAREAGHERVRARGRHRLPHLFHLCARAGRPLGRVPVARPRPQGAQRDRLLVAPPRRVRQALSEVVGVLAQPRTGDLTTQRRVLGLRTMAGESEMVALVEPVDVPAERAFLSTCALVFLASAAGTVWWCGSMVGGMPMPGGWTMSMAWMRMAGQTWAGATASFVGMWVVMMVAMMLPSLVPMLARYRRAVGSARLGPETVLVAAG